MVDNLHSVWNGVGDAILSKESTLELTWLLCWEKEEEILKICSFILFFLTIWKERNRRAFENIDKAKRAIKQCLCLIFGMVEGVYRRLHFVHVGLY